MNSLLNGQANHIREQVSTLLVDPLPQGLERRYAPPHDSDLVSTVKVRILDQSQFVSGILWWNNLSATPPSNRQ